MLSSNTSGVSEDANYIESVFSTYLYTGTGTGVNKTITNGIDLSTKGGLVWTKARSVANSNVLNDTARGFSNYLSSDQTEAQSWAGSLVTMTANSDGYTMNDTNGTWNGSGNSQVSWTFRKQPKFFDVVTYTGTGSATTIAHSLGSVPGCIIIKKTNATGTWCVYHRGLTSANYGIFLNLTAAQTTDPALWNNTAPTSTVFSLGDSTGVNNSGDSYVAYIFAHDAGGFGLNGTDNVISCGSYTDGAGVTVNLGYEPQWLLVKSSTATGNWILLDSMRNMSMTDDAYLMPNSSAAEATFGSSYFQPTATGFYVPQAVLSSGATMLYIAIRRGPMKVPTDGTKVFKPLTYTGTGSTASITGVGFPPSAVLSSSRTGSTDPVFIDKLRGVGLTLRTPQTFAESNIPTTLTSFDQNGVTYGAQGFVNGNTVPYVNYMFQRAPSFFDEVCYTGTGSARTLNHNLGVAPELMLVKWRTGATGEDWYVYSASQGNTKYLSLNTTAAVVSGSSYWNSTTPTSSVFSLGSSSAVNGSGATYVAYLFATCAGVSKVGSYTGTGTTKQIDCGFAAGARFVLIKKTSGTGSWYVWDTARGIVSGNDPYLLLNSTAAEVTSTDYIDAYSAGFEISSTAPSEINENGGSFIFLAIA